jgi:plastocyanin
MVNFHSSLKRPAGRRRAIVMAMIGLAILIALGGIRQLEAAAAEMPVVQISNYQFSPNSLTVPVGATVTWINKDLDVHTVTSDDTPPAFKSAGLDTDDKFSFTFSKAGTYPYHCTLHPHMTGKIVVR